MSENKSLIAVLSICVAYAYFNIGDATIKLLAHKFHFPQILASSCIVMLVFMSIYGFWRGGRQSFIAKKPKWVLLRGVMGTMVSMLNIAALPHIQLTTFYTLIFTSPLWVALLSALLLREKLERRSMTAILAGFAVILFIFRPGGGLFNVWALMVLASALIHSISMIVMRHMGKDESRTMIVMAGSFLTLLVTAPLVPAHFVMPNAYDLGLFVMMGVLGSIGVLCIAFAFQHAPAAAVVAPYHYTQIVWGALLGYFLFSEVPSLRVMTGAVFIIMAGLYLIYGEARRASLVKAMAVPS